MQIYLLRHGETANNLNNVTQDIHNDISLTDNAMQTLKDHAAVIADMFFQHSITDVYCSSMLRARQTLDIVKQAHVSSHQLCIQIDDNLREVDFGDFGGKPDTFEINGKTMQNYRKLAMLYSAGGNDFAFPNGESGSQIRQRCKAIIASLANANAPAVCLIGHNRLFRHLLVELHTWTPLFMFKDKLPHGMLYFAGDFDKQQLLHLAKTE